MRFSVVLVIGFSALLVPCFAPRLAATQEKTLLLQQFEKDTGGWMALGSPTARLQLTHDLSHGRQSSGSLEFDYEANAAHPAAAVLPLPISLTSLTRIGFSIRAASPTAVALGLNEKEGGRYVALIWVPQDIWVPVSLTPADFVLARNSGDPPDPDGKLDLDQVNAIALIDISQVLNSALAQSPVPLAIAVHSGPQKLSINDFGLFGGSGNETPRTPGLIDDFSEATLMWITLGGAELSIAGSDQTMAEPHLVASYEQSEERFVTFIRAMAPQKVDDSGELAFNVASQKPAHLVMSFQEFGPNNQEGPRYNFDFEIAGGNKLVHEKIPLSDFELSKDGAPDPTGKLDLSKAKTAAILDITGAYTQATAVNSLAIGNLRVLTQANAGTPVKASSSGSPAHAVVPASPQR